MIENIEIRKYFPEKDVPTIKGLLSKYKGNEESRVQKAILELAKGSIDGIKYQVECALKDYRDILYWSEHPDEAEEGFKRQIGGMTVNERLFHLNLFEYFDTAVTEKNEAKLRELLKKCLLSNEDIDAIVKSEFNT